MSFLSFMQGFNDTTTALDTLKNNAVARALSQQQYAFNAENQPHTLQVLRANAADALLTNRFNTATHDARVAEFRASVDDKLREMRLRKDLEPKVRELGGLKADADIAVAQNDIFTARTKNLVTPDEWNAVLASSQRPFRVKTGASGKLVLVDMQGNQIGDEVYAEQLLMQLQNSSKYNEAVVDTLNQSAINRSKDSAVYTVPPPDTGTSGYAAATPQTPQAPLRLPALLQPTPPAATAPAPASTQPPTPQKVTSAALPAVGVSLSTAVPVLSSAAGGVRLVSRIYDRYKPSMFQRGDK